MNLCRWWEWKRKSQRRSGRRILDETDGRIRSIWGGDRRHWVTCSCDPQLSAKYTNKHQRLGGTPSRTPLQLIPSHSRNTRGWLSSTSSRKVYAFATLKILVFSPMSPKKWRSQCCSARRTCQRKHRSSGRTSTGLPVSVPWTVCLSSHAASCLLTRRLLAEGQLFLIFVPSQMSFPIDGIRYQDNEQRYTVPAGNNRVSIVSDSGCGSSNRQC